MLAPVPQRWYRHENANTLIGAAILFSGHPYISARYRKPILVCEAQRFNSKVECSWMEISINIVMFSKHKCLFFFLNSISTGSINSCILYMFTSAVLSATKFFICSASYCFVSVIMWCVMKKRHNTLGTHQINVVCTKMLHMSSHQWFMMLLSWKSTRTRLSVLKTTVAYADTIPIR